MQFETDTNWYNSKILINWNIYPYESLEIVKELENQINNTNAKIDLIIEDSISLPSTLIRNLTRINKENPYSFRLIIKDKIAKKLLLSLDTKISIS